MSDATADVVQPVDAPKLEAEAAAVRILGMGPKQWLPAVMIGGGMVASWCLAYMLPESFPESRLAWFGERLDMALYLLVGLVGGGGLASDVVKALRERRGGT